MSTWQPKQPVFLSQLHPDGGGWADCLQASLGWYCQQAGIIPATMSAADVLNAVSLASRGMVDTPSNPYTDLAEVDAALAHYGFPPDWTPSFQTAQAAPWGICLVNGIRLRKLDGSAPYPASWFGYEDQADHFICWCPQYNGHADYFMDPLNPDRQLERYDLGSVAAAFSGAYVLPSTNNGETAPPRIQVIAGCALKPQPNHTSTRIASIPPAGQGLDLGKRVTTGKEVWARIAWRDKQGFVLASNLKAA